MNTWSPHCEPFHRSSFASFGVQVCKRVDKCDNYPSYLGAWLSHLSSLCGGGMRKMFHREERFTDEVEKKANKNAAWSLKNFSAAKNFIKPVASKSSTPLSLKKGDAGEIFHSLKNSSLELQIWSSSKNFRGRRVCNAYRSLNHKRIVYHSKKE